MKLTKIFTPFLLGMSFYFMAIPMSYSYAQQEEDITIIDTLHPTLYMNGGFGKDEADFMRRAGRDFGLRLDFSERKDNEFVADVRLIIEDANGVPVFVLPYAGPMTNVMLPEGKYRILASYRGKTEIHTVIIKGKGGTDVQFHWAGQPRH